MCDRCFISKVKIVDAFVNKPSFVFILLFILRAEFFTCVNPPLGNFTHVLIFFPSKNLTLKFYNIYTHLKHLLVIWIWLTVYDLRKNIGQDFWIRFYCEKTYHLWPRKEHWTRFFSVNEHNLEEKRCFWLKYCEKALERLF